VANRQCSDTHRSVFLNKLNFSKLIVMWNGFCYRDV
jgi:hypothetical protein